MELWTRLGQVVDVARVNAALTGSNKKMQEESTRFTGEMAGSVQEGLDKLGNKIAAQGNTGQNIETAIIPTV